MLSHISPADAFAKVQAGTAKLIDIRDTAEYAEVFIPGAQLVPLTIIARHPLQEAGAAPKTLIFTCRSGKRTEAAQALLEQVISHAAPHRDEPQSDHPDGGAADTAYILEGGLQAWEKAQFPVQRIQGVPLSMFRQIQVAAGSLVLLGLMGSALWHPFFWLSAFVGAGLIFAGLTGFCGMGLLLAKMPWNKR